MQKSSFLLIVAIVLSVNTMGQNIGIGTNTPNPKAALDISSTNKGFLPPRMSEDSMLIMGNAAAGMVVFNTSRSCLMVYNGTKWNCMGTSAENKFGYSGSGTITGADSSNTSEATDLVAGPGGTYFVTGIFSGSKFSLGNNIELTVSPLVAAATHGYVAKYDSKGKCLWALKLVSLNTTSEIRPAAITLNDAGTLFITGTFNDSMFLFNANGTSFNKLFNDVSGDDDIFMIKIFADGNIGWRRREGNGGGVDKGNSVQARGDYVYIGGQFHGTQNFGTATQFSPTSMGGTDGFYCYYDTATGTNCYGGLRFGGTGDDVINDICVTSFKIYTTGSFQNTLNIFTITGPFNVSAAGGSDLFIGSYTIGVPNADWLLCARGNGFESGVSLDELSGFLYIAGVFSSANTSFKHSFYPNGPPELNTKGLNDGMVLKINSATGNYTTSGGLTDCWITTLGGTGQDIIWSLKAGPGNFCSIAGEFNSKLEFANGYPIYSSGGTDGFIATFTTVTGSLYKTATASSLFIDRCKSVLLKTNADMVVVGASSQPALFNGLATDKPLSNNSQAFLWIQQ